MYEMKCNKANHGFEIGPIGPYGEENFYIGTVCHPQGFVTCFLANSPWLVGRTTAGTQPGQGEH